MELIIGGSYQGKTEYAHSLGIRVEDIVDGKCGDIFTDRKYICINNYHLLIKRLLSMNIDPLAFSKELFENNPDIVIISTEIGSGIVPIEKQERVWRESVGKTMTYLASRSQRVTRLCCGIPAVIKGADK